MTDDDIIDAWACRRTDGDFNHSVIDFARVVRHEAGASERARFAAQEKTIERLREWIRVQGEFSDTCTRNVLGEVCDNCRCGRGEG